MLQPNCREQVMAAKWFTKDDAGYLRWCLDHPEGYVANTTQKLNRNYVVLHRAVCVRMSKYPDMEKKPGGFTARGYKKLCAESQSALSIELQGLTGKSQPFSKVCGCVDRRT